jgi:hypothetical protein
MTCGLLHLAWCPPIVSIYLQTTGHYSLWLSKTQVCIYTNFLDLFTSSRATWVVATLQCSHWTYLNILVILLTLLFLELSSYLEFLNWISFPHIDLHLFFFLTPIQCPFLSAIFFCGTEFWTKGLVLSGAL